MHGKWKTIGVFRPKIIHYFQLVIGHSNVLEKDYKSHSKTTNRTCPTGSCNFVIIEKFTRAYYHQIAREIINIQQTEKSVLFFFNKPAYTLGKTNCTSMAKTQSCWGKFIPSERFITNAAKY